jgi:hypothetical protein
VTKSEMTPALGALFGDDPDPARSWALVDPSEKRLVEEIVFANSVDPGSRSLAELRVMGADQRRLWQTHVGRWHSDWPFLRTQSIMRAELLLDSLPTPAPGVAADLIPVPVITGRPGTGKSKLLKQVVARAIAQSGWDSRLEHDHQSPTIRPQFEAHHLHIHPHPLSVVHLRLPGRVRDKELFDRLCKRVGAIPGADPRDAFESAILRNGIHTVALDEVQFINFDGQHGRYVHDALKAIQNLGVRLIMSGHNMREQLREQKTPARQGALVQSEARWDWVDLERYGHSTKAERSQWVWLLTQVESRLRLAGHEHGDTVLSVDFEEYLWVRTLGYMNHLSALIIRACVTASKTPSQRITREIFDALTAGVRAEKGRAMRVQLWESGHFNWNSDFPAALDFHE